MDLENLFTDVIDSPSTPPEGSEGGGQPNTDADVGGNGTSGEGSPDTTGGITDAERNRIAAAARREAERELSTFRSEVDDFYRKNGYKDFFDYKNQYENEQKMRVMGEKHENLGFSGNDISPMVQAIVADMPEFKAAREIAEENLKTQQNFEFEKALKQITELDPTIKTAEDLASMENVDEFNRLVFENGLSLTQAFRLVNMDRLLSRSESKARQDTLNKVNSKSHLTPVSGAPSEEVVAPDDVKAEYRVYFPNMTDEEINEHYRKNH